MTSADEGSVDLVAAALRADAADTVVLVQVLSQTLGDMLPDGMVEVRRTRTLGDRLSGRDGTPVALTVTAPELRLSLAADQRHRGLLHAERQQVVRGVVISRQDLGVEAWVRALAALVTELAASSSEARTALSRLLGTGP